MGLPGSLPQPGHGWLSPTGEGLWFYPNPQADTDTVSGYLLRERPKALSHWASTGQESHEAGGLCFSNKWSAARHRTLHHLPGWPLLLGKLPVHSQ